MFADYLSQVLSNRLWPSKAEFHGYRQGYTMRWNIVTVPKLILIVDGEMEYRQYNRAHRLRRGSMLYRPAWTATRFDVPRAPGASLFWVEFRTEVPDTEPIEPLALSADDLATEVAACERLLALSPFEGERDALRGEGEIKAMLARFFTQARPMPPDPAARAGPGRAAARAVVLAAQWLQRNHAQPDPLSGLAERFGLSTHYFRRTFKGRWGLSAQDYLTTVRMQAARYHVHHSVLSIKQIAALTGYTDPLFFSRQYKTFWGTAPTAHRSTFHSVERSNETTIWNE